MSINSKFNESTQSLPKTEKPSITRNNYLDGKKGKDETTIPW
jgi:hypothetical protein